MSGMVATAAVAFVCAIGMSALPAWAHKEFDLSVGYAHVELDGSESPFDSRGGLRVEPRFSWAPAGDDVTGSHLRLGVGLSFAGFERSTDDDEVFVDDDGDVIVFDSEDVESLTLINPEFQVSYRFVFGPHDPDTNQGWFIEPGIGVGVVIAQYWVGDTFGWWVDTDISEWDATIAGRPFIRAGYQWERWVLGAEGSYLLGGSLDFTDDINGDLREWYVGVFFGGRW
jgi:hypothetical protein